MTLRSSRSPTLRSATYGCRPKSHFYRIFSLLQLRIRVSNPVYVYLIAAAVTECMLAVTHPSFPYTKMKCSLCVEQISSLKITIISQHFCQKHNNPVCTLKSAKINAKRSNFFVGYPNALMDSFSENMRIPIVWLLYIIVVSQNEHIYLTLHFSQLLWIKPITVFILFIP